ncbi:hypothetical protein [Frigoriglobus tundricola]|uniref:Methanolan biosynthesis EpsI domain-containing protein n=1 Tax=Frigoriglobus tundricola TaxID=2774151 RepID=A0A6M5YZX7_9BACT|nr:hypothetical protein [Frigoriglobus tundricola]QJW99687.1 hypothetical protein FTUN_7308 [Frigoriglobus tundricola]
MVRLAAAAAAILLVNGTLHGLWSFRWHSWSDSGVQAERLNDLRRIEDVGDWDRRPLDEREDPLPLPEEVIGKGEVLRFVNRFNKTEVKVLVNCGPTAGLAVHTPRVCYQAHGYSCPTSDRRVPLSAGEGAPAEFTASTFSKSKAGSSEHLRVLWALSDGGAWQTPDVPLKAFKRTPVIYKCYVQRELASPDEPLDGDPAVEFLSALLPRLNAALSGAH